MAAAPAIAVTNLRKVFRLRERRPGLLGAFRGLVSAPVRELAAVDGLT